MDVQATGGMLRFFLDLPDPRAKNVIHKLHDIIVLAVCGVICGAGGWAEVEMFAKSVRGSPPSWTCPGASPATIRSAASSPPSAPTPSSGASPRGWPPWPGSRAGG